MEKKKLIVTGVAIMALIGVVLGATYAYFVAQTGKGANANINVQAGTTDSLRFEVTNNLNIYASLENFAEGKDNLSKSTDLKAILKPNNNTNEARYNYYVYLDISKNELEYTTEENKPELLLKVTKPDGTELTTIEGLVYKSVVNNKGIETSGFDITTKKELITIANGYEIYANGSEITQDWNVEIILVNLGSDQNGNTNKHFEAEAKIQDKKIEFAMLKRPSYIATQYGEEVPAWDWYYYNRINVSKVVFEKDFIKHNDAVSMYDLSEAQDNSINGYVVKNIENENYTLYVNSEIEIFANNDMSHWFSAFGFWESLKIIEGLENINTFNVTNMSHMFGSYSGSSPLDLSSFDTSNVTDMSSMFSWVSSLTTLNLSSFDTSNVTDMSSMFSWVSSLTTLDVSNFDTSNVTNMSSMFSYASSLTTLDVSNFDTSNVTNMSSMFQNCSSLTELDISNMTFDKVTDYYGMFQVVPNNIHIKVKDEAARAFIQARLDDAGKTEGVIEVVNR